MTELPAMLRTQIANRPPEHFAKGMHLAVPDRRESRVWYLHDGLVRLYSLGEDGREHNHGFHGAGDWVHGRLASSALPGCCDGGALGVEALQPTRAAAFRIDELDAWRQADPAVAQFLLTTLMALTAERLEREAALLPRSPEQRYIALLERHPAMLDAVPLQQIAGWLGITPVALSRIRRRLRERGG
jgi:CRP-like cAMP-binding protein